jgi:hypothetical protein
VTANRILETTFLSQNRAGTCALPGNGYEVDFVSMQQTKLATGYQRKVKRQFLTPPPSSGHDLSASTGHSINDTIKPKPPPASVPGHRDPGTAIVPNKGSDGPAAPSNNHRRIKSAHQIDLGDDSPPVPRTGNLKPKKNDEPPIIWWCWKETPSQMSRHDDSVIVSKQDCWIRYSNESSQILEDAFIVGQKDCQPIPGYTVDFTIVSKDETTSSSGPSLNGQHTQKTIKMYFQQTKDSTGYMRDVMRIAVGSEVK